VSGLGTQGFAWGEIRAEEDATNAGGQNFGKKQN
jgi:hypothetical protein